MRADNFFGFSFAKRCAGLKFKSGFTVGSEGPPGEFCGQRCKAPSGTFRSGFKSLIYFYVSESRASGRSIFTLFDGRQHINLRLHILWVCGLRLPLKSSWRWILSALGQQLCSRFGGSWGQFFDVDDVLLGVSCSQDTDVGVKSRSSDNARPDESGAICMKIARHPRLQEAKKARRSMGK